MNLALTALAEQRPSATGERGIYVVAAHPDWQASRVNRLLLDAARVTPGVEVCDLYSRYPDYCIDVAAEQTQLAKARLVVWLHPIHWYSMPALHQLWMEEVLSFGWAYGSAHVSKDAQRAGQALRGKDLWLVATTGGSAESYSPTGYNRYPFEAFLPAYEQTAVLCGMRFAKPLVLHSAHRSGAAEVQAHVERFAKGLACYPDWPELNAQQVQACDVPGSDRPAEA